LQHTNQVGLSVCSFNVLIVSAQHTCNRLIPIQECNALFFAEELLRVA
jgi:hypothetical protein